MWWKITIMAEYVFEIACFVPKIRKPFFLMFNLCFGHFWATETSCKHNTKVLSPYEVDVSNQSLIYMSSTPWSNISIYSEPYLCLPGKWKFNLHSPFSYIFGLHHLLREISVSLVYQSRFTENSSDKQSGDNSLQVHHCELLSHDTWSVDNIKYIIYIYYILYYIAAFKSLSNFSLQCGIGFVMLQVWKPFTNPSSLFLM